MANQIRSERLRQKLLRLADGHADKLQYHLFHLNNLVEADAVCDWLIFRGITGQNFLNWLNENFSGMFIPAYAHIRAEVNRQNTGMPVLIGKDYIRGK